MANHAPTALIAEDEPLLAKELQNHLARLWPELQIVATVGDGVSAVQKTLALQPDVVFMDIQMPGQNGLDAAMASATVATGRPVISAASLSFGQTTSKVLLETASEK